MRMVLLLLVILINVSSVLWAQHNTNNKSLALYSGITHQSSKDELINYYTYEAKQWCPVTLAYQQQNKHYLMDARIAASWYNSNPTSNSNYYSSNNQKSQSYYFSFQYFRKTNCLKNKCLLAYGLQWQSALYIDRQFYNSLLNSSGDRYHKSFDATLASIGFGLQFQYQINTHHLINLTGFYTPDAVLIRPNDNYVKRLQEAPSENQWAIQLGDYISYNINLEYRYQINSRYEALIQASQSYQHHSFMASTTHQSEFLLFGLKRYFK